MNKDETLRLALEAMKINNKAWKLLADSGDAGNWEAEEQGYYQLNEQAINAIKESLETKDEPVAWMCADESLINKGYARFSHVCMGEWKIPVYTTPPQRTWVGLTDEDCDEVERWVEFKEEGSGRIPTPKLIQYIQAKLKEKNNAT